MDDKPILSRWGITPGEQREEVNLNTLESNPGKPEETEPDISTLEQEIDSLKQIVAQQNQVMQRLGTHLQTSPRQITTTKPRDIPVLELHQLHGLNSTTKLQIFFELVEQCSEIDATRVQIAKGRVSTEIAALIHNHQTLHNGNTWNSLKELLNNQFSKEVNFDRAWQDTDSRCYDWSDSPQAFVNDFICRYATLETRFSKEKLPNRDKTIKRKLWQGLPQEAKARLEGFLDEDYPLGKFVDRVEHERQWLEATHTPTLGRVKPDKKNYPPKQDPQPEAHNVSPDELSKSSVTSRESSEVDEIKKQLKDLTEQLGKLQTSPRQPQNERYCSHCRSHTHNLRECWRKPTRGSCFDCRQYGCWRGNKTCPGKPKTT